MSQKALGGFEREFRSVPTVAGLLATALTGTVGGADFNSAEMLRGSIAHRIDCIGEVSVNRPEYAIQGIAHRYPGNHTCNRYHSCYEPILDGCSASVVGTKDLEQISHFEFRKYDRRGKRPPQWQWEGGCNIVVFAT